MFRAFAGVTTRIPLTGTGLGRFYALRGIKAYETRAQPRKPANAAPWPSGQAWSPPRFRFDSRSFLWELPGSGSIPNEMRDDLDPIGADGRELKRRQ